MCFNQQLSLADLILLDTWEGIKMVVPDAETANPGLAKIVTNVKGTPAIKKYLETRKQTSF